MNFSIDYLSGLDKIPPNTLHNPLSILLSWHFYCDCYFQFRLFWLTYYSNQLTHQLHVISSAYIIFIYQVEFYNRYQTSSAIRILGICMCWSSKNTFTTITLEESIYTYNNIILLFCSFSYTLSLIYIFLHRIIYLFT